MGDAGESDGGSPGRPGSRPRDVVEGTPLGRRIFLGLIGLGVVGVVTGDVAPSIAGRVLAPISNVNGSGLGALIPGASRFRIYTVTDGFPDIPDADYRLYVGGLSRHQLTFTLDDLKAMPATGFVKEFECVTGWTVPNVPWVGVRLGHLLELAGPMEDAQAVEFVSYDGAYTESLTLEQAMRSDVIVAYEMLGAPVTVQHGGPVRMYVAPMYGYKSCKWLRTIQLVKQAVPGFWEQQGYAINGWIGNSNGISGPPVD